MLITKIIFSLLFSFGLAFLGFAQTKGKHSFSFKNENLINTYFNYNLTTIDGKKITIDSLKGKPTIINFWFIKCSPCVAELPELNTLKTIFKDSINFISITYDKESEVKEFLKTHNIDYELVVNAKSITDKLGLKWFPRNMFLDKNGKVVKVEFGIPNEKNKNGKLTPGKGNKFVEILRELLQPT
jgi:cytochrome c biogenesis protein CcmG, thiol:disulfide interchange protein DsbE